MFKLECTCLSLEAVEFDRFAAKWFQECLYTPHERASFYVGMSSLVFWFLCMLPQLWKHYKNKSCEGIAGLLLAFWLLGDSLNLLGAMLTHQLAFQQFNAATFCLMDLAMIFQFFYYAKSQPVVPVPAGRAVHRVGSAQPLLVAATAVALVCLVPAPAFALGDSEVETKLIPFCQPEYHTRSALAALGSALGWCSTTCYLSSRVSQIYNNNLQAQAPQGGEDEYCEAEESAGRTMFLFAIAANFLYSLGILLNFKAKALPWLMGSLCVMFLDVCIVRQENAKQLRQQARLQEQQ
ncbi:hypothetical protein BASA81_011309 [Batrachochytrium salamandrivorans]|nr:hypothetical protein BASA81_011309 [Batrachochytrium salamandrivorans]